MEDSKDLDQNLNLELIAKEILSENSEIKAIGFFGSRIKGVSKNGQPVRPDSDLDFFAVTDSLDSEPISELRKRILEKVQTNIPYQPHFEGFINVNSPKGDWDMVLGEEREPEDIKLISRDESVDKQLKVNIFPRE